MKVLTTLQMRMAEAAANANGTSYLRLMEMPVPHVQEQYVKNTASLRKKQKKSPLSAEEEIMVETVM